MPTPIPKISAAPRRRALLLGLGAIVLLPASLRLTRAQEAPVVIPPPRRDLVQSGETAVVTLAGGCFWGVQGVFQRVRGVKSAVSGYSGGAAETASYDMTTRGDTGHAETVEITYDPAIVSYGQLLHIYFSVAHNPTQLNFQGPDRGGNIVRRFSCTAGRKGRSRGPISTNSTPRACSARRSLRRLSRSRLSIPRNSTIRIF